MGCGGLRRTCCQHFRPAPSGRWWSGTDKNGRLNVASHPGWLSYELLVHIARLDSDASKGFGSMRVFHQHRIADKVSHARAERSLAEPLNIVQMFTPVLWMSVTIKIVIHFPFHDGQWLVARNIVLPPTHSR